MRGKGGREGGERWVLGVVDRLPRAQAKTLAITKDRGTPGTD
jgi:hypothetical protein